jgi:hypothetical protein
MTPPDKSFSDDIDLVRVQQEPPELADSTVPPAAYVVPPSRPERCHYMQAALVTGLFACGGFICSILLVDGSDEFLRPLCWPRKSYSSPALATPLKPVTAPIVPQSGTFKLNGEKKMRHYKIAALAIANRRPRLSRSQLQLRNLDCVADRFRDEAGEFRRKFL